MAPFTIPDSLAHIAEGWGISRASLNAKANDVAAQFPDAATRISTLETWIKEQTAQALDPAQFAGTLAGYVADIVRHMGGSDPGAWQGNV